MKAVILHGAVPADAPPDEQDVMVEVDAVRASLKKLGFSTSALPFTMDLPAASSMLGALRPAVVFNLVESVEGMGRLIHMAPALLDALGIPYTGSGTEAVFTTSSKTLAKSMMAAAGIPTARWHTRETLSRGADGFVPGERLIIKSVWEHASIGIDDSSVVRPGTPAELADAMASRAGSLGGECFAEGYIDGREFNLSLIEVAGEPHVLPPAEMRFNGFEPGTLRILDYASKWDEGSERYARTERSFAFGGGDAALVEELSEIARRCWRLFGLKGYARVDFRVDESGRPWVLEVNVNPCISPDAGFMAAAGRAGMDRLEVVHRLVNVALGRGYMDRAIEVPAAV